MRSTEKYLCQFCLINWPWKSKLPPSGETCEWWNLGTLKPNKWRIPQLKEMACYHWISSVFPIDFLSLSWCFMSFDYPFLHCIFKFSVVFLTKVYIVTFMFISFLPPACAFYHYSRWTKYSNSAARTMLNPCTPKSQCFSARVSKSDVRGLIFFVHWG